MVRALWSAKRIRRLEDWAQKELTIKQEDAPQYAPHGPDGKFITNPYDRFPDFGPSAISEAYQNRDLVRRR
jgi:hypothetical protein